MTSPFSLDAQGYFRLDGRPIFPVGVNYWPASCGVEMWPDWPATEIQADLQLIRRLGLNSVRFFVRWQDFEPSPGAYDPSAFERFETFLEWCRREQLWVQPTYFVGWMSGGIFWPAWKGERNLFADPFLRDRAFALAERLAQICARFTDVILAIDQGNEICCLPDAKAASPTAVGSWCAEVNAAIARACPGVLRISGNEQSQVTDDNGWRFGQQEGCDLYSMHTYPNPAWHTLAFDGMTDPLAQSLLPFYVKCARAFGPVMVQEFGTLLTSGACATRYLDAVLPACRQAGANGFLWWCLHDISARVHPYLKNDFESGMGLVDASGQVKPSLRGLLEFTTALSTPPTTTPPADIVLYWPDHYYARGDDRNPGNTPTELSAWMALAHFTLESMGQNVTVRRRLALPDPATRPTMLVSGARLTAVECETLVDWVQAGGRLIWHGPDVTNLGPAASRLLGAVPTDFLAPRATGVEAFGRTWDFSAFSGDVLPGIDSTTAEVVAADDRGRSILLRHQLDQGRVITCLAQPERQFARDADQLAARDTWRSWYAGVLALLD